ncbi:ABC transporter permease [Nocardioides carbamazepini]|uniref:ABC transporter permease n=1 Tax=Nocardioides carbamazepini TaxID=2854259 RepID=UPI00214A5F57|nr:ABC transporter permease [Nocardioides carbamazepini]MCR1784772.1 ABC transporter permease [Nocardioides carbamazepini]
MTLAETIRSSRTKAPTPGERQTRRQQRLTAVVKRILPPTGILLLVGVLWQVASDSFGVPKYILPSLSDIWTSASERWSDTFSSATRVTLQEVLIGFAFAIVVGVVIALALHLSATLRTAFMPLLIGSQAVPIVVIAPVLAIIFGYTLMPKVIVVALICFFSIVVNTMHGLSSVDPELIKVMRTLDASRWAILRRVEIPAALPSFFTGLRISATYASVGAVFGEFAGSLDGLGYVMIQATSQLQTDMVFVAIFILTFMSISLFLAVSIVERLVCPWARKEDRR